jgi:DNA-binding transcriptional ArsR family regulator
MTQSILGSSGIPEFRDILGSMNAAELTEVVEGLVERVSRLEGVKPRTAPGDVTLVQQLLEGLGDGPVEPGTAMVVYAGAGPWEDGTVLWQIGRSWDDVASASDETVARVLSALANGTRLRIVVELLRGPVSTGELADRLNQPSPGQLFHHLKELIAAGLIHQPVRGTYAIRRQHAVPLLAVLSAAIELTAPIGESGEPS